MSSKNRGLETDHCYLICARLFSSCRIKAMTAMTGMPVREPVFHSWLTDFLYGPALATCIQGSPVYKAEPIVVFP